ncbi:MULTISPECIES: bifunctional lysylphosphatidylglycerol flippase/synthetase MprF [Haematobacter]|uniref:Lysylphosphatidylglycerol synthetase n=2 Tax=Haematobacter TaxID=366614 RepID=A0A212A7J1_9RHOB|nr:MULTISPECIES: bifunctional lysylphosphatidylglycerol flippase/synthetase MprF [Haematobacter]OWJ75215.1 lysylphosphatidylglycerol synthetase [Haematobacter genomosp. 1]
MTEKNMEMPRPSPEKTGVAKLAVRLLEPRVAGPLIGAVIAVIATVVIYKISDELRLDDIKAAITGTPRIALAEALGFTVLSFCALGLYDVLASRRVAPDRVPVRLAAFAGAVAYAISNAIGFHVVVGSSIRYRIYQAAGLDASDVGRIVGISFLSFTAGIGAVIGLALLLDPDGIPFLQIVSPMADRVIGGVIVAAILAALLWLSRNPREVMLFNWRLPLPSARNATAQILVAAADIAAAAAALYVLLPGDVTQGYAMFLILFVVALVIGTVSHAPGGLGVFEATVLLGLGAGNRPDVVAALVLFRVIYYFLPLAIAGIAFLGFEGYRARHAVRAVAGRVSPVVQRIVPPLAGTATLVGGCILLLSGNVPALADRVGLLSGLIPLPFAEASHLMASVAGLFLIVISRGLFRRIARARLLALCLLCAGAVFSLAKGLDWEEASGLLAAALLLAMFPGAFYRRGRMRSFRLTPTWLALLIVIIAFFTLIGLLAYRHVDYENNLWWSFDWDGDASRFLRATLALVIITGALTIDSWLNRPTGRQVSGPVEIPDAVRRILKTTSATQPNVALLGDKSFMVSADETAFLMYGEQGNSWIALGDPVGDAEAGRRLIWRFAEAADRNGMRAIHYSVTPEWLAVYLELGLALLKTGEVARVDLHSFSLEGPSRQDFRYADKRATREGLEFSVIPAAEVPAALEDLRGVSDAWLETKHGAEKGFSLGRFDDDYIKEFDIAVLRKEGAIVAFANLWRSGDNLNELSIDLMRYRPGVSKVIMDALFARLLLYGKAEGYRWFNLGAAPLAGLADHPLASTWNRLGTFIYRRGDEFYNFEGLRAFKQKFGPVWTSQYLACPGGFAMPQALMDVTALISGNPIRVLKR